MDTRVRRCTKGVGPPLQQMQPKSVVLGGRHQVFLDAGALIGKVVAAISGVAAENEAAALTQQQQLMQLHASYSPPPQPGRQRQRRPQMPSSVPGRIITGGMHEQI